MPAEEITKLTQDEIIELIRLGNVDALEQAVWDRCIEVPQDLFNFQVSASNAEGDSALHVAARFRQPKIMQYLITGLCWEVDKVVAEDEEPQKEIKTWGLCASVKNINGEMAIDIVKGNTEAEKKMSVMLKAAALEPGPDRDNNMRLIKETPISDDMLPKKNEDYNVAWGNRNRYTGSKDEMGNVRDSAVLHMQVLAEVTEKRAALNKARDAREAAKDRFLLKAEIGNLSEQDVQEYVATGGRIDCAIDRKNRDGRDNPNGGKNILHLAIEKGYSEIVEKLLKGIEVKSGGENEAGQVIRLNFDVKASELLQKALKDNPNSKNHQAIADILKDPKTVIAQAESVSLRAVNRQVKPVGATR